ncbi:hypothetical protein H5410_055724 [Solanum commersonii]|uniref:Uncharacterized protein n=1 Tax=Solanum commersonii TaxID=4109 RepID=A0A9J5WL24_SOLCO|nr:hypothetical protein H5410_055724 [Solanum commersonii]
MTEEEFIKQGNGYLCGRKRGPVNIRDSDVDLLCRNIAINWECYFNQPMVWTLLILFLVMLRNLTLATVYETFQIHPADFAKRIFSCLPKGGALPLPSLEEVSVDTVPSKST